MLELYPHVFGSYWKAANLGYRELVDEATNQIASQSHLNDGDMAAITIRTLNRAISDMTSSSVLNVSVSATDVRFKSKDGPKKLGKVSHGELVNIARGLYTYLYDDKGHAA